MNAATLSSKHKLYLNYVVLGSIPLAMGMAYAYDLWLWLLAGLVYSKVMSIFSVQIALHRYFAHSSFKTGKLGHIFLSYVTLLSAQSSPSVWASIHKYHHMHSDTVRDIHSPKQSGFWYAALFWYTSYYSNNNRAEMIKASMMLPNKWKNDRHVAIVDKYYLHFWIVLSIITLLMSWKLTLFIFYFGGGVSLFTANLVINALSHSKLPGSYVNYETNDLSYNNKWIQRIIGGEGLHNNHHKFPGRYSQAMYPGEHDVAAWIIKKLFINKNI